MAKDIKILDKFKEEETTEEEIEEEEKDKETEEEDEEEEDEEKEEVAPEFTCGIIIRLLPDNSGLRIDRLEPHQGVEREPNDGDIMLIAGILLKRMLVGEITAAVTTTVVRAMNRKTLSPEGRKLFQ